MTQDLPTGRRTRRERPRPETAAATAPRKGAQVARDTTEAVANVHSISSPEMIFRDVIQGLYDGSYVPGQRLVETDLTQRWGVGRGTVREALNRLAAEGVVVLSRHRGAAIRKLDPSEMRDILALLEVMIGMAARLAANRIAEGENRLLLLDCFGALQALRERPDSFELVKARNRFYRTLATIGGNRELQSLLGKMHVHLLRVQLRAQHAGLVTERFDDYSRIKDAVLSGNGSRAELAARRHVRATAAVLDAITA